MRNVVASYFYSDPTLTPIARVDRIEPGLNGASKSFLPYLWDASEGNYSRSAGLKGTNLPLYRAHEVRAAIAGRQTIFVVEGEGKGDRLRDVLRAADSIAAVTTIHGGANAPFRDDHVEALAGAEGVVVLADSDAPGRLAARSRAQRIADAHMGCDVRVIDLYPDRDDGSDVAEWLGDDHTIAELDSLIEAAQRVTHSPVAGSATIQAANDWMTERIVTKPLAAVEPREVMWLWDRRIVSGEFGIVAGLPGVGKSYLCAAIATAISRGLALPGGAGRVEPADTIILSLEDDPASVLRPRFERLGAELNRIHVVEGVRRGDEIEPFSFAHVTLMDRLLDEIPGTALVIIDPIASRLSGVDTWRSNEVRSVLDPFIARASSRGVSVLAVAHVTKSRDGHAMMKIEGSLGGFVGRARFVLAAGRDENGRCGVGLLKSNYGPTQGVPVVTYSIDPETGTFAWGDETTAIDPGDLFAVPATAQDRSASEEAYDAIVDCLRAGELLANEFSRRVRADGVSPATFNRVRPKMRTAGVIERLGGGVTGPVRWRLAAIDSQEEPQIRTLQGANECASMRKSEDDAPYVEVVI